MIQIWAHANVLATDDPSVPDLHAAISGFNITKIQVPSKSGFLRRPPDFRIDTPQHTQGHPKTFFS
jgi:hypothetical protein